jgi:hypothetical protein
MRIGFFDLNETGDALFPLTVSSHMFIPCPDSFNALPL